MNDTEDVVVDTLAEKPWDRLIDSIEGGDSEAAFELLQSLSIDDQRYILSYLDSDEQAELFSLLTPIQAARLLERLPEAQAVEILEDVDPEISADIIQEFSDDDGADFLREMNKEDASALLAEIDDPEDAQALLERANYRWDTAGGLMSDSFLAFPEKFTVGDILSELNNNAEQYNHLNVQYIYVVDDLGHLQGVLRLRDLVLNRRTTPTSELMIPAPSHVWVDDDFERLLDVFEEKGFLGLPVLERSGLLVGVVTRHEVNEATADHQTENYLKASGIVGGEELRSMSVMSRTWRRMAWLIPNIPLSLFAGAVIAVFENTLETVIALAVFLPIISNMSGNAGNQAVAVSIREMALGVLRPNEYWRTMWKEASVGVINGLVLGALLGLVAYLWKGNVWLGLVVATALAASTLFAVIIGGCIPLFLKRLKADPALAAGPILTTLTDVGAFFLALKIATLMIQRLQ